MGLVGASLVTEEGVIDTRKFAVYILLMLDGQRLDDSPLMFTRGSRNVSPHRSAVGDLQFNISGDKIIWAGLSVLGHR